MVDIIHGDFEGLYPATLSYIPRSFKILVVNCSEKFWDDFWSSTLSYVGLPNKEIAIVFNAHQHYNLLKGLFELQKVPSDNWWTKFINATRPEHADFALHYLQLFLDLKQCKNERIAKLNIPDIIVG